MKGKRASWPADTIVDVPIDSIRLDVFVRRGLSDPHVKMLQSLIEEGADLPPIEVTADTHTIVDGRHRLQAHKFLGRTAIRAVLVPEMPRAELLARALGENVGGALPPTTDDVYHTVYQMLEAGMGKRAIVERITFFPAPMVKKAIQWAESNRQKRFVKAALAAMADENLTARQAADRFQLDIALIKAAMSGRIRTQKTVQTISANVERTFRSTSHKMRHEMQQAIELHDAGAVAAKEARAVIAQVIKNAQRMKVTAEDFLARLQAQEVHDKDVPKPRLIRKGAS
jgi:hypothetical protein